MNKRLRGMVDILPATAGAWQRLESAVRDAMRAYGYGEMRTPLLEATELFVRSIGEATDIVEKEMYTFPDRKGKSMTLRPENTASCVRAVIENGLLQPGSVHRIWYQGPMFRYERPQAGRQRQFHQVGAEVYGVPGPGIEAELILLGQHIWQALGIDDVIRLELNTLGSAEDRQRFRAALVAYFDAQIDALDDDSRRRLGSNPLRILDSKNPQMQALIEAAPKLSDVLSDASRAHFETLCNTLERCGVSYSLNSRLVRGLDYYSHTVFEWTTDRLGAQSAIAGGGRYDGMLEEFGARDTPGVGWAMGMERVVLLLEELAPQSLNAAPDVFLIAQSEVPQADALSLAERLRVALPGRTVMWNPVAASLKNQLRRADKLQARVAVIVGEHEHNSGELTLKPLRGSELAQQTQPLDDAIERLSSILAEDSVR